MRFNLGGTGEFKLPSPVPCDPSFHPIFEDSRLFVILIANYCTMLCNFFLFLLLPTPLGILLPLHLPPPWESYFPYISHPLGNPTSPTSPTPLGILLPLHLPPPWEFYFPYISHPLGNPASPTSPTTLGILLPLHLPPPWEFCFPPPLFPPPVHLPPRFLPGFLPVSPSTI